MRRIKKAGLMLNKVPVREILDAGVELSNELYLTPVMLERMAINSVGTAHPTRKCLKGT
jgi:hypothetical protein